MPASRYRIALVIDDIEVHEWVRNLAHWAASHPSIELAAFVIHSPRNGLRLWDKLFFMESKLLSPSRAYRSYAQLHSIAGHAPVQLRAKASSSAPQCFDLDAKDLARLKALNLDAFVRCGRAEASAAILRIARDGMISISVGSEQTHSAAAGFLEVVEGQPETRFTIERQRGDQEPQILFSGSVATGLFFGSSLISLYARAFPYLQRTLEQLAAGIVPKIAGETNERRRAARAADLLTYGRRSARRTLRKAVRRFWGKEFNWQVAFMRQSWSSNGWSNGKVIPNPAGAFLADPFTIRVEGVHYLFVEEYSFSKRKGVISAYCLDGDEPQRIGVVLEERHHLSFPFLFRFEGEIYMVPETREDRSVKIYKCSNFPCGWSEAAVLLNDVPAVDTIMFKHGPLWWMLTTIQGEGPGLNNAELHAFHAQGPFGEWIPHKMNPVVMDARRGRNGGFLRDENGNPCRVAQVPGFTVYGAGSSIYRIDEISPEIYRESEIDQLRPTFFPKLDGTHHIHSADGLTVYDFMRVERPQPGRAPREEQQASSANGEAMGNGQARRAWSKS